jgi:PAS domain-containing protein
MSASAQQRVGEITLAIREVKSASKNANRGIRIAELPHVSRALRIGLFGLVVVVTGATGALSFVSFTRKVATFRTAGFTSERAGDALVVRSVERESSAQAAGLHPGDRIVLADGRTAGSLEWPEKDLARRPLPHHLVVISGGAISAVAIGEPAVRPDYTYLFLAFVGLLYLVIGLFTLARERAPASRVFWALCLASFAIYVITPAGPHDAIWKASWLAEDFFRALLPALLLHLFLIFPKPARSRRLVPLLYLPALAYMAAEPVVLSMTGPSALRASETMTRLWFLYFVLYAAVVMVRLTALVTTRAVPAAEKQARWIALGVTVGLAPFVLLSALPRALGFASPLLSTIAVVPLVFIPLAFAWAILKWRLWDVEIFVREAVAATGAVLLGGMMFVLLNALLDRTLVGMAEAGKNVIAFASGIVLASLLVPVKRRLTDALEKIQYRETYRARRALLEVARDFSAPRPKEELVHAIVRRVEEGLHVVPCSLFLFDNGDGETPEATLLMTRLDSTEVWRLRAAAFGELEHPAARHLHAMGYRTFFAMKSGGKLAGALGVGHKDGRVPLSSEDESLLRAVMAQAGLAYENARLYGALADRLEEIRTLQQYQESVIQSSSSGIVVLDAADHVHSANPAFAQLVGRAEGELVGLPFSEVLPGVEPGPAPVRRPRTGSRRRRRDDARGAIRGRRRDSARPPRLRLAPPGRAGPQSPPRRRRHRSPGARARRRRARAPRVARHSRGGRRSRGQHSDRGPLLVRAAPPGRDPARRSALRDPEEDGATDLPRRAPRQQPPGVRAAALARENPHGPAGGPRQRGGVRRDVVRSAEAHDRVERRHRTGGGARRPARDRAGLHRPPHERARRLPRRRRHRRRREP